MSGHASVSNEPCSECGLEAYDPDCRLCGDHEVSFCGGAQAQPDAESEAPKFRYGPWGQFKTDGRKIEIVPAGRPGVIATVKVADEVDEANAHLIAASTDLYEALTVAEAALVDLGACDNPKCTEPNCLGALTKVRAALRKAEGCE